jgi:hypothetical protein
MREVSYSVQRDAGDRLDAAARDIMRRDNLSYRDALVKASKELPQLFSAWDTGVRTAKNYDKLPESEQQMIHAQNDPNWVIQLAEAVFDHHANLMAGSHVRGTGQVSPESYRAALVSLRQQFPSLARAADDGFIGATDYELLCTLVPSVSTEVWKLHKAKPLNLRSDNYSSSTSVRRYDSEGREFRTYVK